MATFVSYNPKPIKQGADWSLSFIVEDTNGLPVNLTGWTGTCQLRERPGGEILATVTVTVTGATGTVKLALKASITTTLPTIELMGDCFITNGSATECLWEGKIIVTPKVTL